MTVTLFRQQAVDHQRVRVWGEVAVSLPTSYAVVTGFLALSICAAAVFIGTQTYARKERATGFLMPTGGVVRVTPPRSGTITEVFVAEGQHVDRGAALLAVADAETSERGEDIDSAKAEQLRRQRDDLREQIALEGEKTRIDGQRLQSQIDSANEQIDVLNHQLTIQNERIEIARRQVDGAVELAGRGYLSAVELRRRQDAYLGEQQTKASLLKERSAKAAELAALRDNLRQLPVTTGQSVAQLQGSIAEIDTRLKELDGRRGYQLQATIAGRVSALQAWVGKTADPKMPVLSIIPDGEALEAELLVPARAVGFVAPGQTVQISYDTFPFQQFGFAHGTVRSVSHTLLRPEEVVGPVQAREPSYPVNVALERQTVTAYGAELPLEPDLQLQAEIVSERRSIFGWLIDPVLGAWRRS